ncbi:type II secretion system protein [Neobacillus notoginsengisoli]|uniref:type II secretion system protein n=1 Tax=Neobacillus notoginsengisoli TaxID=1578198 RepID=UPI0013145464|nr:type II secretion system protein [Neobacillus notoginsengisoli]
MRKNRGFFLAEMLLSLSALCVAALFLVPALMFVYDKSDQIKREKNARKLLYAELLASEADGILPRNDKKNIDGTSYSIRYMERSDGGGEVCVEYVHLSEKKALCAKRE